MRYARLLLLPALALAGCVTAATGGGSRTLGAAERWLAFGPVEAVAGGATLGDIDATALAVDPTGRLLLVSSASWGPDRPFERDLFVATSTDRGGSWTTPAILHPEFLGEGFNDGAPRVAVDGRGHAVVVWTRYLPRTEAPFGEQPVVMTARSTDGGRTWGEPLRLTAAPDEPEAEEFGPVVQTDGRGAWMCAWIWVDRASPSGDGAPQGYARLVYAVSRDAGAAWTVPRSLHRGAEAGRVDIHEPALASGGPATFSLGWTDTIEVPGEPPLRHILAATTRDGGDRWSMPVLVHDSYGRGLELAYGRGGTCLATWDLGAWTEAGWTSEAVAVARSDSFGANWTLPQRLDPAPSAGMVGQGAVPGLATDGQGHWMRVWQATGVGGAGEIVGSVSLDHGVNWSAPARLGDAVPVPASPLVAALPGGRWMVLWRRDAGATDSLIYRINDLPRAWWRHVEVGVGISTSFPL